MSLLVFLAKDYCLVDLLIVVPKADITRSFFNSCLFPCLIQFVLGSIVSGLNETFDCSSVLTGLTVLTGLGVIEACIDGIGEACLSFSSSSVVIFKFS
jgi:hypothetical protein